LDHEAPASPQSFFINSPYLQPTSAPGTPSAFLQTSAPGSQVLSAILGPTPSHSEILQTPGSRASGTQRTPIIAQSLPSSQWFLSPLLLAKDSPSMGWKDSPLGGAGHSPQVSPIMSHLDSASKRKACAPLSPFSSFHEPSLSLHRQGADPRGASYPPPKRPRREESVPPGSNLGYGGRTGGRFAMLSAFDQEPTSLGSLGPDVYPFPDVGMASPCLGYARHDLSGEGADFAQEPLDGIWKSTLGSMPPESPSLAAITASGGGGMIDQAVAAVKEWQSDALKSPDLRLATPNQILPLPSPLISPLLSPLTQQQTPMPAPKVAGMEA